MPDGNDVVSVTVNDDPGNSNLRGPLRDRVPAGKVCLERGPPWAVLLSEHRITRPQMSEHPSAELPCVSDGGERDQRADPFVPCRREEPYRAAHAVPDVAHAPTLQGVDDRPEVRDLLGDRGVEKAPLGLTVPAEGDPQGRDPERRQRCGQSLRPGSILVRGDAVSEDDEVSALGGTGCEGKGESFTLGIGEARRSRRLSHGLTRKGTVPDAQRLPHHELTGADGGLEFGPCYCDPAVSDLSGVVPAVAVAVVRTKVPAGRVPFSAQASKRRVGSRRRTSWTSPVRRPSLSA